LHDGRLDDALWVVGMTLTPVLSSGKFWLCMFRFMM